MKKFMVWMISIVVLLTGCAREQEVYKESVDQRKEVYTSEKIADTRKFGDFGNSEVEPLVVYLPGTGATVLNEGEDAKKYYPSTYYAGMHRVEGVFDAVHGNIFAQAIKEYSEANNVPIEIYFVQEFIGVEPILMHQYAEGELPDLWISGKKTEYDFATLAEHDLLLDFGSFMDQDDSLRDDEKYYTKVVQGGRIDGKQYILPLLFNMNGMLTSESYLREIDRRIPEEQLDLEEMIELLDASCRAMQEDKGKAAIFETSSGRVFAGDYIPSILMSAAHPSYYNLEMGQYEIDEALLKSIFDMKLSYYEQEYNGVSNWKEMDLLYFQSHPNAKGSILFAEGLNAYDKVGIFLSGGRAGGVNFHNSLLMDAAFFRSFYQEDGETMVFQGIPTIENPESYSANISAMALGFSTTEQPEEVYKLARYLMDYDYTAFYGFSVNKERTEKQLEDALITEIKLPADTAWIYQQAGDITVEEIEKQTTILRPLDEETIEKIRFMLDHMAGAGVPYPPVECWLYGKAQDDLLMRKKSPEEAAKWVAQELERYQKEERKPFENMVDWEYAE